MNKQKRCAIYTRKSTDEGLEQDFNSLDAQRMAAENYIASQKHEGWICLPERYDDGGFSGGNLERPALKKLLEDVEKGKIDIIVVYKVDRLSRSLLDFSRIIEILDKHKASFVSVTQHFNTTDSMGRLTLNILLSFAQFEREIISERTRDKMSMQRKLGKFTGGRPILGYDTVPGGGAITVNPEEAELVRQIFGVYLERRSVLETVRAIRANGWRNKRWKNRDGKMSGGSEFTTSTLYGLLTNKTYTGKLDFNGREYDGEHEAIVAPEIFERVRELLRGNRNAGGGKTGARGPGGGILGTKLKCSHCGTTMFHTYTRRNGKKYNYYVCAGAKQNGFHTCPHPSLSAVEVENFVVNEIAVMAHDRELHREMEEIATEKHAANISALKARMELLKKEHADQDEILRNTASKLSVAELADIQDETARLETEMKLLGRELADLEKHAFEPLPFEWFRKNFTRIWEAVTQPEKSRIVELMIESIVFDAERGTLKINYRDHGIQAVVDHITYSGGNHGAGN